AQKRNVYRLAETQLAALNAHEKFHRHFSVHIAKSSPTSDPVHTKLQVTIKHQDIWASGVTYYSSRRARIAESKDAGGGDFYDRVFTAKRPEIFFKALGHKVAGPNRDR